LPFRSRLSSISFPAYPANGLPSLLFLSSWLIILPVELVACAILVNYWIESINNGVWITIAMIVVVAINCAGARGYGEAEFWFATIKVLTIVGLIITGIALNVGAGPTNTGYKGFTYWKNPGPLTQYKDIPGTLGQFRASLSPFLHPSQLEAYLCFSSLIAVGFFSVLIQAGFSFIGTEIVAITFVSLCSLFPPARFDPELTSIPSPFLSAGEAQNPRRNLPRAIRRVYIRILFFYVLGTFMIGIIVPSNNKRLGTSSDAAASPFVIAISEAGIKVLPSIINACLITSAWSAASSDLYTSSRALYGIALEGNLPKIFTRTTKNGLPWFALIVASSFCSLAYMALSVGAGKVFNYLANMTAM
jgi:amino acid transporter